MAAAGLQPNVTNTKRSRKTQSDLYVAYQAGLSPYPAARPGHSQHELGLALDITTNDRSRLRDAGALWESFGKGFRWGGRFGDPIHFDYKP
jgi:hypothetical protein